MSSELGGNTWQQFMSQARSRFAEPVPLECQGRLTRLTGMVLEASGLRVPVGAQCHIHQAGQEPVLAEVVGFVTKLIADRESHKLLGIQVLGGGSVDKMVDIAVAGISMGARVEDFDTMDFAYAPPFSTAIHPFARQLTHLKITAYRQRRFTT